MCILSSNVLGYLLGLLGPTVIIAAELYWAVTDEDIPLTSSQKRAFELMGLSGSTLRLFLIIFCTGTLAVCVPLNILLLLKCSLSDILG